MSVDPLTIAGALATLAAGCAGAIWLGRVVARTGRAVVDMHDDWKGEPARPGVRGRLGVMERLDRIEKELQPNGGSSMRDAVNRVETNQGALDQRLTEHIATHGQPVQVNVGMPQTQTPPNP